MNNKERTIIISLLVVLTISVLALVIITCIRLFQPTVVNNYNYSIDTVENFVVEEKKNEDFIIADKPYTNESTSTTEVYSGYTLQKLNYADMGYTTPVFKYIDLKIDGWILKKEYQKILYEKCKKYNINYIQALAIAYKEQSFNNPNAENHNSNGTTDYGIMQVNSIHQDIILKLKQSTDTEWLKDPETNIECAIYLLNRNRNKYNCDDLFYSLVMYNGGYGSVLKIKKGEHSFDCPPLLYAASCINIMNLLYERYINMS